MNHADLFVDLLSRFGLPIALLVVLWRYHVSRQDNTERLIAAKELECAKVILAKDVEIKRLNDERLKQADKHREDAARLSDRYSQEKTRIVLAATEAARELSATVALLRERRYDDDRSDRG